MQKPLAAVAVVLGTFAAAAAASRASIAAHTQSTSGGSAVGVILAEVLFDPAPGDTPFVEVLNTGSAPVDLTRTAIGIGELQLPLARVTEPLAPGARLLVRFDGAGRVEPGVVHLPPSVTLNAESGAIALIDERGETIDRVAWGDEHGAVDGEIGELFEEEARHGRTVGRPPGANRPLSVGDWVEYSPGDATPGAENPLPVVEDLMPLPGEIVNGPDVEFRWYGVVGAESYRVQIAREVSFAAPVVDETVSATRLRTSLDNGQYFWRVQGRDAAGRPGRFSSPGQLEVTRAAGTVGSPRMALAMSPRMRTQSSSPALDQPTRILAVPFLWQHKDTAMLQLENIKKNDPHGWDRDHKAFDASDPADDTNCVPASVAMINHFFKGDLSQDRIAYEVRSRNGAQYAAQINNAPTRAGLPSTFGPTRVERRLREKQTGAEWDLNYGDGMNGAQIAAALTFALGDLPAYQRFRNHADLWAAITGEIDAGRPLLGMRKRHVVAVVGYGMRNGKRVLVAHNPNKGPETMREVDAFPAWEYGWFFVPANARGTRQEISVRQDSDFDGVVDFDETERFFTDPNNRDSDGDGVWDKADIASGVFDSTYGYAAHTASTKGRDFDGDDRPTERDRDSDDGGCRDGVEDADGDGDRVSPESWNFDDTDDLCGEISGTIVSRTHIRHTIGAQITESHSTMVVTVRLREEQPGESGPLVDNGSRFRISSTGTIKLAFDGTCQPFGRETGSGSGSFGPPDSEIGGYLSEDGLVVGASASIQGTGTADLCVMAGSGPTQISAALPECLGERIGTSRSYRFSCTTPPPLLPGMTGMEFLEWSMTGVVTLAPPTP